MIDCRSLDVVADLDRLLALARRHTPPLPLLVTPEQRAAIDADVVDGHAYIDDVPLWIVGGERPPPRPVPPVVVEPVVDLDAAKAERKAAITRELWAHVEARVDRDEMMALIATRLTAASMPSPNPEAMSLLDGMQTWISACMITSAMLGETVGMCSTLEEVEAIAPDLSTLPPPTIVSAGTLTFMLVTYGGP